MKHSKWALRLISDVTTSDRSVPTSVFLKIDPRRRGGIRLSVVPYTHSQLVKVQKHFIFIWFGFVKHSKWGLRLISDVTTSDRSIPTPNYHKSKRKQQLMRDKIILSRYFFYKIGRLIILLYQYTNGCMIGCHQHGILSTYYMKTGKIPRTEPTQDPPEKKVDFDTPNGPLPLIFFLRNFIEIILVHRWMDLSTYFGHRGDLKKWHFFYRTP